MWTCSRESMLSRLSVHLVMLTLLLLLLLFILHTCTVLSIAGTFIYSIHIICVDRFSLQSLYRLVNQLPAPTYC